MPRVSEAHLAARRQQILEASWRCFARDGFHGTTMQDIFEESGLSAGAVYRYFPGKIDLVKATAETVLGGVSQTFDAVDAAEPVPPPDVAFRMVVDGIMNSTVIGAADHSRIAIHIWSEALRDPTIGSAVRELAGRLRQRWTAVATRWRAAGYIPAQVAPDDVARVMYGLLAGYVQERHIVGDVSADQYVAGFAGLFAGRGGAASS
ncbi:TetR/AcrR family transcriptional regulator [Phytoactinopolyspora limicola]|uniref:TetR/AcrR family transcriptional regulator n=1 Tax=Phytoactinopolyspora limicola TaxID=2715536 RepID=UPI00140AA4F5|nr:TetR/AcrR family transcriptional regulator [Phytoactinopolyspora limicola]